MYFTFQFISKLSVDIYSIERNMIEVRIAVKLSHYQPVRATGKQPEIKVFPNAFQRGNIFSIIINHFILYSILSGHILFQLDSFFMVSVRYKIYRIYRVHTAQTSDKANNITLFSSNFHIYSM